MNVSHIATGEAQMAHFLNAVETGAITGRAQRLDELMTRWRKQVMKRKGLLSTVSILPLAACGGSDPMTLATLAISNPTADISARTDLSGFRLDFQNATTELTMTLEQHNATSFINTAGTQTVVLTTAGTTSTKSGIENYEILEGTTLTISPGTDGVNVTENDEDPTTGAVSIVDISGRTLTGNFLDFDSTDILKVTQNANISGASGDGVTAGTALGFGTLDFADTDGVSLTMTRDQHESITTLLNTANSQTFAITTAGTITAHDGIENYLLSADGNTITVNTNEAGVNITGGAGADTVVVAGLTVTGTYTDVETISATAGANISGLNAGAATGAGTLNVNNSVGTFTMSAAQHQGLATVNNTAGAQTFAITTGGAITARDGIEEYTLSADGNTITVNSAKVGVNVTGGAGADTIVVGGLATVNGTYTGLTAIDTISATAGANLSLVNTGGAIGAGILDVNNSAGTFTITQAQHQGLATVNNTDGVQTFALSTAGVLTAREGIENYTLHNDAGNVISVLAGTNVNASVASADVIRVAGLTVTGTYQTGIEDTISATAGANISGAAIGSVDALDINNSAGTYTMTQAQHEQLATVSNTTNAQTFVLTSAGTITARNGIENYHLADAGGSIFTQSATTTPVTVKSGAGDDLIITNAVDANRDALTIDLTSGGNDTVRILNDSGSVTAYTNVVTFGALTTGQTLIINGVTYTAPGNVDAETVAEEIAGLTYGATHQSSVASGAEVTFTSIGSEFTAGFTAISGSGADTIVSNVATQGGLVANDFAAFGGGNGGSYNDGNFVATDFRWDDQEGTFAVTVDGFTAKSGFSSSSEKDTVQLEGWSGGYRTIDIGANSLLNFGSGGTIEIDATTYSVSGDQFENLQTVAQQLANLNNLGDGGYYIIIYNGDDVDTADAGLYYARATAGNGLNFQDTNGAAGGYDTDSLELLAIFNEVGANSFSSDNFLIIQPS